MVIFIMGPTAAGKTGLAVELVKRLKNSNSPGEIISVDSALIYKGMNIGTAKPDQQTLTEAPHRLIDILEPTEAYSAGQFRRDAMTEIESILEQGGVPILVGGTMLYFNALFNGLAELPESDPAIRSSLQQEIDNNGLKSLHDRLRQLDPASAKKIHPNDKQRTMRALEVYEISGTLLSKLQQQTMQPFPYSSHKVIVTPENREILHQRIEQRFQQMLKEGFIAEVEQLIKKYNLSGDEPAMRSVGYRQVLSYLRNELSYAEMVERAIIATRQLAKRQYTWLRSLTKADPTIRNVTGCDEVLEVSTELTPLNRA